MNPFFWLTPEVVSIVLFFIGLLGLILRKNMMFSIISIAIMNIAVILFFVTMNASPDLAPPMVADTVAGGADPVPQALMITSVVIGLSVQAVCLVLVMQLFSEYRTLNWSEARQIRERLMGHLPGEQIQV